MNHVHWAMECVGHSFSLPLDKEVDYETCKGALMLYAAWLDVGRPAPGAPNVRPACMQGPAEEAAVMSHIVEHLSQLFEDRPGLGRQVPDGSVLVQRHVDLCSRALDVWLDIARQQQARPWLSTVCWEGLLRVVLGVSDNVLFRDSGGGAETDSGGGSVGGEADDEPFYVGDRLDRKIVRVLIEIWLRSNTRDEKLWSLLKGCFERWQHRKGLLQQWNASMIGLTTRLLRVLWPELGSTNCDIRWSDGHETVLDLASDQVVYVWHKFMDLFARSASRPNGSSRLQNNAAVYLAAIKGIANIQDVFLSVGMVPQPGEESAIANALPNSIGSPLADLLTQRAPRKPLLRQLAREGWGGGSPQSSREGGGGRKKTRNSNSSFARLTRNAGGRNLSAGGGGGGGSASGGGGGRRTTSRMQKWTDSSMEACALAQDDDNERLAHALLLPPPPDVDELYDLFGPWLLPACQTTDPLLGTVRATAVGALCRLFSAQTGRGRAVREQHLVQVRDRVMC